MFTPVEIVGNLTYILLAISYWARDMVWLRLLTIPACVCGIIFGACFSGGPIWVIINWNILFLGINCFQLGRIWFGSRARLDSVLEPFALLMRPLNQLQLSQLTKLGSIEDSRLSKTLIAEGQFADQIYFLLRGSATVWQNGEPIAICRQGSFLGDIGFVTDNKSSAKVVLEPNSITLCWDSSILKKMLSLNPDVSAVFHERLAIAVCRKLAKKESNSIEFESGSDLVLETRELETQTG